MKFIMGFKAFYDDGSTVDNWRIVEADKLTQEVISDWLWDVGYCYNCCTAVPTFITRLDE